MYAAKLINSIKLILMELSLISYHINMARGITTLPFVQLNIFDGKLSASSGRFLQFASNRHRLFNAF